MPLTVSALHVYPVKSLKGLDLDTARCTERGLEHDRRWMVVDSNGRFLTQREHPRMATVWTELSEGALSLSAPDVSTVDVPLDPRPLAPIPVQVWDSVCEALPVSPYADAWLSGYLGMPCRLVYMPESTRRASKIGTGQGESLVGFADGYAHLVTTEASLEDLNARLAAKGHRALPMNRFRPNLVIAGAMAFEEDGWKEIRIGEVVLRVTKPCGRCEVPSTDQTTGERSSPEPLATLSTFRQSPTYGVMFGMNCVTVKTGEIRVGDKVEVA